MTREEAGFFFLIQLQIKNQSQWRNMKGRHFLALDLSNTAHMPSAGGDPVRGQAGTERPSVRGATATTCPMSGFQGRPADPGRAQRRDSSQRFREQSGSGHSWALLRPGDSPTKPEHPSLSSTPLATAPPRFCSIEGEQTQHKC